MSTLVEQIKARLGIVDVISTYLKLEKSGSTLRARCPFHNEKTPSFFVSPARNSFYCFGCSKGGDIFTFIQEIEGADFKGALQVLAARAGLQVDDFHETRAELNEKTILKRLLETATDFYVEKLKKYQEALDYAHQRGISDTTLANFRLGYAPDSWRNLYEYCKARGYNDEQLVRSGMVIKSERGHYDRFRHRLMFPMADTLGGTIAFSGRLLPDSAQTAGKEAAKYINSPETPLYSKSSFLYGYDKAKLAIRQTEAAVLVEGQMDLVMSHQAGVTNTVAVSGTALTEIHLQLLKRLAHTVIIAFDQDVAGFNAARRGIELALTTGLNVRLACVPHAKDPADLVRENPQLWRDVTVAADHIVEALLKTIVVRGLLGSEERRAVEAEILPYIPRLQSKLDQAHYVRRIAEFLNVNEESVWASLKALAGPLISQNRREEGRESKPTLAKWLRIAQKLAGILLLAQQRSPALRVPAELGARLEQVLGRVRMNEVWGDENKKNALLFEAELSFQANPNLRDECTQLLVVLEEELLKERLEACRQQLRAAEKEKQQSEVDRLVEECNRISQQMRMIRTENRLKHL